MSSLLIAEPPLQVLPTLACRIGLNEAIVLQQLHYVCLRQSRDGWVSKPIDDWCDVFPFLSQRSLERAFSGLRKRGLVMVELVPGGGRRTRCRIDHDALDALIDDGAQEPGPTRQIGGTNPPNWRDQPAKLAAPACVKGPERKQQRKRQMLLRSSARADPPRGTSGRSSRHG